MKGLKIEDALGREIIKGCFYGYSQNKNGFTNVRIGIAENSTPTGKLTMKVTYAAEAMYNGVLTEETLRKNKITVNSKMVFPVQPELLKKKHV